MESNQSDENYEEFREEGQTLSGDGSSERKVFVRTMKTTTTSSTKTQKSITTTLDTTTTTNSAPTTPVPLPRRSATASTSSSTVQLLTGNGGVGGDLHQPPGVCSNITTIIFREGDEGNVPQGQDFARLEALARQREETPGGVRTRTTTTVHHRTVTHLNPSSVDYEVQHHQSPGPHLLRPTTLPITHSSDNDSLLEDTSCSVQEESATFQNIHKFTSTYESTPVSSPMSSHQDMSRFTSGDSLYRHHHLNSSTSFAPSPMGSPLSGSHNQGVATDEWKFNRTHQFQTKTGFYRSISQYDSHIKEIRGEEGVFNLGMDKISRSR